MKTNGHSGLDYLSLFAAPCAILRLKLTTRERSIMNGQHRKEIHPGAPVEIILKADQRTGKRTAGIVKDILTSAAYHSRGIKVRLENGQIGRVQEVLRDEITPSHSFAG